MSKYAFQNASLYEELCLYVQDSVISADNNNTIRPRRGK
jgi:hypothetical protein